MASLLAIYGNMDILPKAMKMIIMAILVLDRVACVKFCSLAWLHCTCTCYYKQ